MAEATPAQDPEGGKPGPASPDRSAQQSSAPAAPASSGAAGTDGTDRAPGDDLKRKFRAALDRKRAQQAEHNAQRGGTGAGKVPGAHGPAHSRRSFRRKSGG